MYTIDMNSIKQLIAFYKADKLCLMRLTLAGRYDDYKKMYMGQTKIMFHYMTILE